MKSLTLGSLFDGSGGFPLAAQHVGIEPRWASEIEPFPIRVTRKRFPNMKHLGDINKVNGAEIEPVDVITFGSPCQSWSTAGTRKGLEGESGLFLQAVRVIKEMRHATNDVYPRVAIMENVPGLLNCHGGDDFAEVLVRLCSIQDTKIECVRPKKWESAGCLMADNFSIAWRILNAKHFGVPQVRRRVFLVIDFGDQYRGGAKQVLFEREMFEGDTETRYQKEAMLAKSSGGNGAEANSASGIPVEYHPTDSRIKFRSDDTFQTLCSRMGTGGNATPLVLDDVPLALSRADFFTRPLWNLMWPLMATDSKEAPIVLLSRSSTGGGHTPYLRRITPTECARLQGFPDDWSNGFADENPSDEDVIFFQKIWDEWDNIRGVRHKSERQVRTWLTTEPPDSAKYKMFGNGVALPCVEFIMRRIKEALSDSSS